MAKDLLRYPTDAACYSKGVRVGGTEDGSSSVWAGVCDDYGEVALKIVDLETQTSLRQVKVEVQAMGQLAHPNLAPLYTAFVHRNELWLVMQLHSPGSCADIMQWALPGGFEESSALFILREVGRGLAYLHEHGTLHRHLKSSNILIDGGGDVRLTDFGICGSLYDGGEWRERAKTFVGSPAWMAPEVLEQAGGYDASADIWSFGITAMELSTGVAPYAGLPPLKVMLHILQEAPPIPRRGSAAFVEMVAGCLQRTPSARTSAGRLLQTRALSALREPEARNGLLPTISKLPPLHERYASLRSGERAAIDPVLAEEQQAPIAASVVASAETDASAVRAAWQPASCEAQAACVDGTRRPEAPPSSSDATAPSSGAANSPGASPQIPRQPSFSWDFGDARHAEGPPTPTPSQPQLCSATSDACPSGVGALCSSAGDAPARCESRPSAEAVRADVASVAVCIGGSHDEGDAAGRAEPPTLRSIQRLTAAADDELEGLRERACALLAEMVPCTWPSASRPALMLEVCTALRAHLREQNEQLRAHNAALRSLFTLPPAQGVATPHAAASTPHPPSHPPMPAPAPLPPTTLPDMRPGGLSSPEEALSQPTDLASGCSTTGTPSGTASSAASPQMPPYSLAARTLATDAPTCAEPWAVGERATQPPQPAASDSAPCNP